MASRRRSDRWIRRVLVVVAVVGALTTYRNRTIAKYSAEHPDLFE